METIVLLLAIWTRSGPMVAKAPQPSIEACLAAAGEFLKQKPEALDAMRIAATCVREDDVGDPA